MAWHGKRFAPLAEGPDWVPRFIGDGRKRRNKFGSGGLWIWLLLNYYLSIPALALLPPALLFAAYGSLMPTSPLRMAVLLLVAIGLVDLVLGFVFRPKLTIRRRLPERVRAGSEFEVEYEVENRRKRPAYDLEFDPGFGVRYFESVEPARTSGCAPGETFTIRSRLRAARRGKYLMGPPGAVARFPLGLFKFHTAGRRPPSPVVVYPAYTPLRKLELPTGRRFQNAGLNRVSKVSEAADFCGCRGFRAGDNPRHIHWRGSARRGELIVREFQEEYLSRAALILDSCTRMMPNRRSDALEAALSLAAAAADRLLAGELVIDLFIAGPHVCHFQAGRSLAGFEAMLDVLAGVEAEKKPSIAALSKRVLDEIAGIGSALVILLDLDAERLRLLDELAAAGTAVKTVVIAARCPERLPPGALHLTPDCILSGQLTEL